MKGLLKKDILSLRNSLGIFVLFLLVYIVVGLASDTSSFVVAVLAVVLMSLPVNSISYDEFYRWDQYVLTMPISRTMVVRSKYLFCLLLVLFMMVIGVLFGMLLYGDFGRAFVETALVAEASFLISSLSLPCIFKWGSAKGRMILVLLCAAMGGLVAIILAWSKDLNGNGAALVVQNAVVTEGLLCGGLLVVTLLVSGMSYWLSCRIYQNKQF